MPTRAPTPSCLFRRGARCPPSLPLLTSACSDLALHSSPCLCSCSCSRSRPACSTRTFSWHTTQHHHRARHQSVAQTSEGVRAPSLPPSPHL